MGSQLPHINLPLSTSQRQADKAAWAFIAAFCMLVVGFLAFLYGFDAGMGGGAAWWEEAMFPIGLGLLLGGSLLNTISTVGGAYLLAKAGPRWWLLWWWPLSLLLWITIVATIVFQTVFAS